MVFFEKISLTGETKARHATSCHHCHHHYKIISLQIKKVGIFPRKLCVPGSTEHSAETGAFPVDMEAQERTVTAMVKGFGVLPKTILQHDTHHSGIF